MLVFHVDMDAFFVSVEELFDPSLKGKPVVVGGRGPERGVVSAASYAAREFGVHSAMSLRDAHARCPQAVFLPGNPEKYREYSERVHRVLREFSPKVSQASIDEAYIDMTGSERLFGPPLSAAHRLHEAVREETGLACSIGLGRSRLVAKIGSGLAKPNGVFWALPGTEAELLAPLPVKKIPGCGKVMTKSLAESGIRLIGDVQRLDAAYLRKRWGEGGLALAGKARGEDAGAWFSTGIGGRELPKSISHETTFGEDTADREVIDATLAKLVQLVARRLREHRLYTRTVQLKLRYKGFETITRAKTLEEATELDSVMLRTIRDLFDKNWEEGRPIRLLGVHAGGLTDPVGQLGLLDVEERRKWTRALGAADRLRDRFGEGAVGLAAAMKHGRRERVHENPAGLPGKGPAGDERDERE